MSISKEHDRVSFGPLGELKLSELEKFGLPPLLPNWRKFSTLDMLLVRAKALRIMRLSLELQKLAKREDIPIAVRRELYVKALNTYYEGLLLLRNIDEHFFNVQYALYDVI